MPGNCDIKLSHKCPSAESGHHADDLVNCYVMKGKLMGVDPIIDACTTGGREVHYQTPLPRLTLFGNNPKATYMKVGEGRRSERAAPLPRETSWAKYLSMTKGCW